MESLNPQALFNEWYQRALTDLGPEASRCVIATCDPAGQPSARIVYHRPDEAGRIRFFTNYQGRKGVELATNPKAAVCFDWQGLKRQVRVEGTFTKVAPSQSDAYFYGRPLASQLAAILSAQSQPIESIDRLRQEHAARLASLVGETPLVRPEHWGGYELEALRFEFWSAGADRLHERRAFTKENGKWVARLLSP